MIKETLIAISLITNVSLSTLGVATPSSGIEKGNVIARQELDLTNRLINYPEGSQIFADNILLSLHYLKGDVNDIKLSSDSSRQARTISSPDDIDWDKVRQPFEVSFVLEPEQTFAFHANVLPEYKNYIYSTNSHFSYDQGYKSLNGLAGNGVCHIASLITWVSQEAGLKTVAPTNHDFYPIPGIDRKYGTSILYGEGSGSAAQNLYIRNNLEVPVKFELKADNKKVTLQVSK